MQTFIEWLNLTPDDFITEAERNQPSLRVKNITKYLIVFKHLEIDVSEHQKYFIYLKQKKLKTNCLQKTR
jgi:hypothetical protein